MNITNYINWNGSPEIFTFAGFSIGWYGLLFASGFYLGFHLTQWIFKHENKDINSLDRFFVYMVVAAIIGGRLGHCIFYAPDYYFANPLEIFKIWHGGLASHGGAVGMLLAMYLYAKNSRGISYLWLLDRMTMPIALGAFFIRLGNFFNSEVIGIPTTVPWAIIFSRIDLVPRHPSQLYEALVYLVLFIILLFIYNKKGKSIKSGYMMSLLLIIIFTSRFMLEFVKTPQEDFLPLYNINMGQWLSLPLIGLGLYLMFRKSESLK